MEETTACFQPPGADPPAHSPWLSFLRASDPGFVDLPEHLRNQHPRSTRLNKGKKEIDRSVRLPAKKTTKKTYVSNHTFAQLIYRLLYSSAIQRPANLGFWRPGRCTGSKGCEGERERVWFTRKTERSSRPGGTRPVYAIGFTERSSRPPLGLKSTRFARWRVVHAILTIDEVAIRLNLLNKILFY